MRKDGWHVRRGYIARPYRRQQQDAAQRRHQKRARANLVHVTSHGPAEQVCQVEAKEKARSEQIVAKSRVRRVTPMTRVDDRDNRREDHERRNCADRDCGKMLVQLRDQSANRAGFGGLALLVVVVMVKVGTSLLFIGGLPPRQPAMLWGRAALAMLTRVLMMLVLMVMVVVVVVVVVVVFMLALRLTHTAQIEIHGHPQEGDAHS
mmetsp:Transcript_20396/g.65121  ORF Transcript_20396/g.65121 Transcript_20396/m.65121 type:complete len:206 (-) Transcript_20396:697-1314(-)